MNRRAGLRLVRALARCAALAYPAGFRRAHGETFADVAEHWWRREAGRTGALRATIVTSRLLATDTLTGLRIAWRRPADAGRTPRTSLVARFGTWFAGGGRDIRLAVRGFRRQPGAVALIIVTLAIGLGASAAAFDALDRVVIRPLPFAGGDRLVFLSMLDTARGFWFTPDQDLVDRWRAQAQGFDRIEVFREGSAVLDRAEGAERLATVAVSGGLPGLLAVAPLRGRLLQPGDAAPGAPDVVMVTERAWRSRFGADPSLVGRVLTLGGRPFTVVGIWPGGARITMSSVPDLVTVLPRGTEIRPGQLAQVIARRTAGVSPDTAVAELRALTPAGSRAADDPVVTAFAPGVAALGQPFVRGVWLVFAGGLVLLVVAVANAGHLLLARTSMRVPELAVRRALGGSRAVLLRLFAVEGLLCAAGGAAGGLEVMAGLERLIGRFEPRLFLPVAGAGLEGRAFAFMSLAGGAAALACALAPLLRVHRAELDGALTGAAPGRATPARSRTTSLLVAVQAALAVLLVSGATVLARSVANLMSVDTGMTIEQLVEVPVVAPASRFPTPAARAAYFAQVEATLRSLPAVTGITTSGTPLMNTSIQAGLPYLDGEAAPEGDDSQWTGSASVPRNYFDVLGMTIVAGRGFDEADGRAVAVVNEHFARSRQGDVIGRVIHGPDDRSAFRIVGVVADTAAFGITDEAPRPVIYWPEPPAPRTGTFERYIVRTSGDPAALARDARSRLAAIDRAVPVLAPETGPETRRRQTAQHRFVAVLLTGLAGLGLALALSGVYGAVAMSVAARRREIGVRVALGATAARVRRTIVGGGMRPVLAGAGVGLAVAWFALPAVDVLLFRVTPRDPSSAAMAVGLVVAAAVLATWWPAGRASRIDPAITLRQ
ncbi:MAG: ABC transporter permease [Vicinamibacterales bacterium]